MTALHLPELKFHPPPAAVHSSVLHPHKSRTAHDAGGGSPHGGLGVQWLTARPALLPLAFTLQPSGTLGVLKTATLPLPPTLTLSPP